MADILLRGGSQVIGGFSESDNARDSTPQPPRRSTRLVGKQCARRDVLFRSTSGERGSFKKCIT